ncbi:MAG: MGDG synthase family glycosyltransferase [Planctomycetota bacterium]|jgi:processive 1,2-diacylglycerol beta-glucosyltransferase
MTRLLILSAGVGAGHNSAAKALDAAVREHSLDVRSRWFDALRSTSRFFRSLYADSYLMMANYSPTLWGFLYKVMGKKSERKTLDTLVKAYDRLAYPRLMETVGEYAPDAVICTHFLPANVLIAHRMGPPVYTVVTDFDVHSFWVNTKADGYFVASEEVRWQMRHHGFPLEKVQVTGIPVHPSFAGPGDAAAARRKIGVRGKAPIILFISGGFGMGDMEAAVQRILSLKADFRLFALCGRNETMRRKLARRVRASRGRLKVGGMVPDLHEYMRAADLAITKAGGLSVSECLALSLPMILFAPIPGQEEHNADYLLERGAAVKAKAPEVLDFKLKELLDAPHLLAKMRRAAKAIARPNAARDVIGHVLRNLE